METTTKGDPMAKKTTPLTPKLTTIEDQPTPAENLPPQELASEAETAPVKTVKKAKAAAPEAAPKADNAPKTDKAVKTEKPEKTEKAAKPAKKPLNFKVPAEFRREFKTYASTHDLKLNRLLELAFASYRKQRGD